MQAQADFSPAATLLNLTNSVTGNARYIGKRTKRGNAYLLHLLDGGQRIAQFYVPLVNHASPDVDVKGEAFRIDGNTGQFDPLHGEVLQTVLFFARRGITNGL